VSDLQVNNKGKNIIYDIAIRKQSLSFLLIPIKINLIKISVIFLPHNHEGSEIVELVKKIFEVPNL